MATEMQVWVGNLGDYNAGRINGEWLDPLDPGFDEAVEKIVGDGEHYIADSEGFFGLKVEKMSLSEIKAVAEKIEEMKDDAEAFVKWCDHLGADPCDKSDDDFREAYRGHHSSEEEYAEELFREIYEIPDHLDSYIDWEKVARDMFICDCFSIECDTGGIYVFINT